MNQQAFNLLGAFLAIGAIAGIWFYFAEDAAIDEAKPDREIRQTTETQRQRATPSPRSGSPSAVKHYSVDYPELAQWFEEQPKVIITARPDPSIAAICNRQDALLAALLGGFTTEGSLPEDHINHLKGIILNPSATASVSWRPIIGNDPPVHPVSLAHELMGISPQESMVDEFSRLIRFASPSTIELTISDLDSRIARWRKFHADSPSSNRTRSTHNTRYLNAMAMMSQLLQFYQRRNSEALRAQYTPDQARQHWASFEANELPRLASFIHSSTVETAPLFDGKTFDTAYTPVNHHFFLRGSIHGRTVYIQIMPENSSLIRFAGPVN